MPTPCGISGNVSPSATRLSVQVLIGDELEEVDLIRVGEDVAVQWHAVSQADPKVRHVLHGPTPSCKLVSWRWHGVSEASLGYSCASLSFVRALAAAVAGKRLVGAPEGLQRGELLQYELQIGVRCSRSRLIQNWHPVHLLSADGRSDGTVGGRDRA
jgi:hypothetical protein